MIIHVLLFLFSFICFLIMPFFLVLVKKDYKGALLICIFALVFLLAINIDKIQSFKLWGVEAQLKEVIQEANATIKQVKNIALNNAEATLTQLMADRFGSFHSSALSLAGRLKIHDNVIASLQEIGATEDEIFEAKKGWNQGVKILYFIGIRHGLFGNYKGQSEGQKNRQQFRDEFQKLANTSEDIDFFEWEVPSPDQIDNYIRVKSWEFDQDTKELIEDYRYFLKNRKIRNRDRFIEIR